MAQYDSNLDGQYDGAEYILPARFLRGDAEYARTHADADDESFMWPSVRLAREQERAHYDYPLVSESSSNDPAEALKGVTDYPAAVHEVQEHRDEFEEYTFEHHRWLGFTSIEGAALYVNTFGRGYDLPGPGEGLGDSHSRSAHVNPWYRAPEQPRGGNVR